MLPSRDRDVCIMWMTRRHLFVLPSRDRDICVMWMTRRHLFVLPSRDRDVCVMWMTRRHLFVLPSRDLEEHADAQQTLSRGLSGISRDRGGHGADCYVHPRINCKEQKELTKLINQLIN
jgi:hypothetical protein